MSEMVVSEGVVDPRLSGAVEVANPIEEAPLVEETVPIKPAELVLLFEQPSTERAADLTAAIVTEHVIAASPAPTLPEILRRKVRFDSAGAAALGHARINMFAMVTVWDNDELTRQFPKAGIDQHLARIRERVFEEYGATSASAADNGYPSWPWEPSCLEKTRDNRSEFIIERQHSEPFVDVLVDDVARAESAAKRGLPKTRLQTAQTQLFEEGYV